MFSSIFISVRGAVDTLKGYVAARWLDFRGWFKPRFASCKETVQARTERARFAVKDCCNHVRVAAAFAVAVALDHSRRARARILAMAPLVRDGLALVVGLASAFVGTQVVLGAAQAIGLVIIKLAMLALIADILIGLLPWQSRADLRRTLRGAVAAGMLGTAFAAATVATALDPGPTTSAVAPVSATSPESPVVAAHDLAVAPEPEATAPARHADRRARRRMAGSNGRA